MPRVAHGLADGLIYHIINRGNGWQDVFHKEQDFLDERTFQRWVPGPMQIETTRGNTGSVPINPTILIKH